MGVQKTYGYATSKGVAGGIYDMFHYPVDSRFNEEATGKLHFGVGVVTGKVPGSSVALPTSASTADNFEGVVINGFDRQQDLEGKLYVLNNQNVGVMRRGRVWVRLATGAAPAYGDALHMIVEGDEAGCFAKEGGIAIPGRFIGDGAGRKINRYLVAVCNLRRRFGAFQNREADVDGVAVENAREARRNDAGDAARADGNRRMFAGGTAAEVRAADDDVPRLHLLRKGCVNVLHAVLRKLIGRGGVQVARGDNHIRIHVVAVFVNLAAGHVTAPPLQRRSGLRRSP